MRKTRFTEEQMAAILREQHWLESIVNLRAKSVLLACMSTLWLSLPTFGYDPFAFPGHGKQSDWMRACNCIREATTLASQNDHKKALFLYDKSIAIYPTAAAYFDRANSLFALKHSSEQKQLG